MKMFKWLNNNIVAIVCVICATVLIVQERGHYGWLLFGAFIAITRPPNDVKPK